MALETGSQLGHYEVVSSLGAGGMGEVYRARDTRLGREVAIKLLLDEVSSDPNRLARFEREARVLASLNHPNVATLFGFERAGETSFLVMELVEGETLADRIQRGPVPVDEAIPLFLAIAEGLEAAHERGIVHRDLKPANIKLGPQGTVKILDFGLAKAMAEDAGSGSAALSHSPTLTLAATQHGEILGTAAYMSPEQARGALVDRRADIWAFAVCLYEALTGTTPFEGDSLADVVAAVLRGEPQWELLPAATPARVIQLLRRGLERDLRFRLRDIGEAWVLLQSAEPVAAAPAGASGPRHVTRFLAEFPAGHYLGITYQPFAVSPRGDAIVCSLRGEGTENLYLRRMDELSFRRIPGTEIGRAPFFSPDGTRLGFFQRRSMRYVVLDGGAPQTVVKCGATPISAVWTPEGEIVWGELKNGLQRVRADGTDRRQLTDFTEAQQTPFSNAGAGWILANAVSFMPVMEHWLQLVSTRTGEQLRVDLPAGQSLVTGTGRLVFQGTRGESELFSVPVMGDPPRVTDRPVRVARGIAVDTDGAALFDVSANGTLVYSPAEERALTGKIYWVGRGGAREEIPTAPNCFYSPRFSPDGETLALVADDRAGIRQIHLLDYRRGVLEKLTSERRAGLAPVWYPNGNRLAYSAMLDGTRVEARAISLEDFVSHPLVTSSAPSRGKEEPQVDGLVGDVSPDGRWLAFARSDSLVDLAIVVRDEEGNEEVLVEARARNTCPRFHPSGQYFSYISNESGRFEVYVRPFHRPGRRIQVSIKGGSDPVWSRDGKELFYRNGDTLFAVPVEVGETLRVGAPEALFDFEFGATVSLFTPCFDVHPDGQRFVVSDLVAGDRGARHLVVVQNWTAELEEGGP